MEEIAGYAEITNTQLRHDIRGDLSVLGLGLEALTGSRDDVAQFDELIAMMRDNVESLRTKLEILVDRADGCRR